MKKILPIVIVVLVVGALAFFGGVKYEQNKITQQRSALRNGQQFSAMGGAGLGNRGNNGGFTTGEIISKDDKSVTLKLRDGGSKIIFFSDSAKIMKSAEGTSSDLEIGKTVMVSGKQNSDGSFTAETIQLGSSTPPAQ